MLRYVSCIFRFPNDQSESFAMSLAAVTSERLYMSYTAVDRCKQSSCFSLPVRSEVERYELFSYSILVTAYTLHLTLVLDGTSPVVALMLEVSW